MAGRMEILPILLDFVPYRGHCPARAQLLPKNCIKRGKGTADHAYEASWRLVVLCFLWRCLSIVFNPNGFCPLLFTYLHLFPLLDSNRKSARSFRPSFYLCVFQSVGPSLGRLFFMT